MAEKTQPTLGQMFNVDQEVATVYDPDQMINHPLELLSFEPDEGFGGQEIIRATHRSLQTDELILFRWSSRSKPFKQLMHLMSSDVELPIRTFVQRDGKYHKYG